MIADIICKNQDEWFTPEYAIIPLLKYLKKGSVIWCPFDTNESNFVKVLRENGFTVFATHISKNEDFFGFNHDFNCDYIISNLPYSLKGKVLQRLFKLNKPFAMLVGVLGLFESKDRFDMFSKNNFEIMYFDKRVCFFNNLGTNLEISAPPFSSVYVCHNILPKQIVFEKINKNNKFIFSQEVIK